MIALWMLAATLFAALLGVAAFAAERMLRTMGREARGPWFVALAIAVTWPVVAPIAITLLPSPRNGGAPAIAEAANPIATAIGGALPATGAGWIDWLNFGLLMLWMIASAVLLLRFGLALRALSQVERSATKEIIAGVRVLVTPTLGPAVFGARKPRILVPNWLRDLDAPLQALVLRHEQEHCAARDPQLTLAVALIVALLPWNIGVWWLARRLRLAVELDCDVRVLRGGESADRYGKLLLFIAQRQSQTRLAPMLAESNSHLSQRITEMNAPRPTKPFVRTAVMASVAVASLVFSTSYAADLTVAPTLPARPVKVAAPVAQAANQECLVGVPPSPARPLAASAPPRYPDMLKTDGVEGEVIVQFVVDTFGVADARSFKVLKTSHAPFATAATTALGSMKFAPAVVNGKKVKQLLQQSFYFDMAPIPGGAGKPGRATAATCSAPGPKAVWSLQPIVVYARGA